MKSPLIVLAYSGGLDTSIIVPWLKENYNARVVCVAGDVGQGDELEGVRAKALASGAEECYIEDLRETLVTDAKIGTAGALLLALVALSPLAIGTAPATQVETTLVPRTSSGATVMMSRSRMTKPTSPRGRSRAA